MAGLRLGVLFAAERLLETEEPTLIFVYLRYANSYGYGLLSERLRSSWSDENKLSYIHIAEIAFMEMVESRSFNGNYIEHRLVGR